MQCGRSVAFRQSGRVISFVCLFGQANGRESRKGGGGRVREEASLALYDLSSHLSHLTGMIIVRIFEQVTILGLGDRSEM